MTHALPPKLPPQLQSVTCHLRQSLDHTFNGVTRLIVLALSRFQLAAPGGFSGNSSAASHQPAALCRIRDPYSFRS